MLACAVAALAGCGGSDEVPPPEPAVIEQPQRQVAQVPRLIGLEVGQMHRAVALTAFGEAPTGGWSAPQLRPRSGAPGPDGFLDIDMVAEPPQGDMQIQVITRLRADLQIPVATLSGARGLRVHARDGSQTVSFGQ